MFSSITCRNSTKSTGTENVYVITRLVCGKGVDHIDSVRAAEAFGPALVRLHRLGAFDEGVEEILVLDAEPFAQVAKHERTVLLDLEVAGQVLLVESVVVHLHLGEGAEVVRHEHHRRVHVLQFLYTGGGAR
jgi:hypothetical protein